LDLADVDGQQGKDVRTPPVESGGQQATSEVVAALGQHVTAVVDVVDVVTGVGQHEVVPVELDS
jgi:hypothetical protein